MSVRPPTYNTYVGRGELHALAPLVSRGDRARFFYLLRRIDFGAVAIHGVLLDRDAPGHPPQHGVAGVPQLLSNTYSSSDW